MKPLGAFYFGEYVDLIIRRATLEDKAEWFCMRRGLWPDAPDEYLDFDMDDILSSERDAVLMAFRDGQAVGMIEARLREYGEGCETSPVGYIEGWYVNDALREQGIGARRRRLGARKRLHGDGIGYMA